MSWASRFARAQTLAWLAPLHHAHEAAVTASTSMFFKGGESNISEYNPIGLELGLGLANGPIRTPFTKRYHGGPWAHE